MTSMNEIPDNELDDLFRKSAEEMEVPFDPEAWQRMEKKLDGTARTDKNAWMRWGWLGLLLLLVGTGTYLWMQPLSENRNARPLTHNPAGMASGNEVAATKPVVSTDNDPKTAAKQDTKETNNNSERPAQPATKDAGPALPETKSETPITNQTKVVKSKSEEEQQPAMVAPIRTAEISRKKHASLSDASRKATTDKKLRRFFPSPALVPAPASEDGTSKLIATERTETPANGLAGTKASSAVQNMGKKRGEDQTRDSKIVSPENEKPVTFLPADSPLEANIRTNRMLVDNYTENDGQRVYYPLLMAKGIQAKPATVEMLSIEPKEVPPATPPAGTIQPKPEPSAPRLGVRFVLAPDMSTVGFRNFIQPGTNIGIMFEYRLTDRLLVSTGGLYTRKVYTAKGSDYNPPDGYWTNRPGYDLRTVNAGCNIIDIPLNIRYDFIQRQRSNWFVTVGASSYLMKREDYEYHYYYYGKYKVSDWSIRNSNNHFFAVGNLSLGYEHAISSRLSWQVEPYLKLPLGGVGFGKIKLVSSGMFFSVKYHPFVRK